MRIKFPRRQSKVEWGGVDTVSFESSISQAAQALDLAGYYASHRRDSEGLVQVSHGWARLGEVFLALPHHGEDIPPEQETGFRGQRREEGENLNEQD